MSFTRTPGGLAEKWRFHQVPTIWVEGPTDIFFYEPITQGISCRMEAFHGAENARSLVQSLVDHDYPYLVVLDGDYEVLKPSRSVHRLVLTLSRYSFENFLWEQDAVNRACLRHARCGEDKDIVGTEMRRIAEQLKKELFDVVTLDIAARRSVSPPAVLPDRLEMIQLDSNRPDVDPKKIAAIISAVEAKLDVKTVKAAQADVRAYLGTRCITHLLNGHLVLSILRRIFLRAAKKESGLNPSIPNDALTQILAEMVWRRCTSDEHKRLKQSLRRKIRQLLSKYPATTNN